MEGEKERQPCSRLLGLWHCVTCKSCWINVEPVSSHEC